ncbi:MAG: substrate-binding periplasmic protein [Bdellovibrionales bacterium]
MKKSYLIVFILISLVFGLMMGGSFAGRDRGNGEARPLHKTAFERVMATKTLRCGYVVYAPYFELSAKTGKPVGVMVDLMEDIGRRLGIKIVWSEEVGWGTMLEGVNNGRYDAICTEVWQTPARAMHATFSTPFGYASIYSWVRSDTVRLSEDPLKLNTKEVRITTMDGELGALLAQSLFPKAQTVTIPQNSSIADLFMNVVTRKADVLFQEENAAHHFLKNNPRSVRKLSPKPVAVYPMVLVLPFGDTKLKEAIDSALFEMMYSPRYDQILAPYGGSEGLMFKKPALPYLN